MSTLETNSIGKYSGNNVSIDDALNLKSYDTAGRDALTSVAGDLIYNTTDSKVQVYDGSAWEDAGGLKTAEIDYLIIAGGGGGGPAYNFSYGSGGGGSGGYMNSYNSETSGNNASTLPSLRILCDGSTTYTVTVGAGGTGGSGTSASANGNESVFYNLTALGGGRGNRRGAYHPEAGSGEANYSNGDSSQKFIGRPRATVGQFGQGGGGAADTAGGGGGGGAGAGANGSNANGSTSGGNGGNGLASTITGSSVTRAGGGGGAGGNTGGSGGTGGGGNGGSGSGNGSAGTVNTGSGGGGADIGINGSRSGGAGASGTVILRWATADATIGATRTGLTDGGVQTNGSDSYIVFTAGTGSITFS